MLMLAHSAIRIAFLATEPTQAWWAKLPPWTIPAAVSVILLIAILIVKARDWPSNRRAKHRNTLDPMQLEQLMIATPPQIVDLRPRQIYDEKGHIRGALNIPYDEFDKRIDELDTSHPRPIVLVDDNDALSHQAMTLLEERGHRWLYVLKGGFRAWRRTKLPVYSTPLDKKK